MATATTITIPARIFAPEDTLTGLGFTVEEVRVGKAEFSAFRRNDADGNPADHSELRVSHVTRIGMWEFKDTGNFHIDVRNDDGHSHTLNLGSADDAQAVIDMLTEAIANRRIV